jgi:hypothetical protein
MGKAKIGFPYLGGVPFFRKNSMRPDDTSTTENALSYLSV